MKRKKAVIGAAVLAIAAGTAAWFLLPRDRGDGAIRVSGNIEVTDVDVGFKIPGRVVQRAVDEGMAVSAGQLVARLDNADLAGEVSVRQAELQAAAAALQELAAGSRPQEIARAKAAVAAAGAEAERLSRDFSRAKTLLEREAIARQEFDRAKAAFDVAEERHKEARENLLLVEEGPRREQIDQARARVRQAKEALELARTRLSYATVASPLSGIVLSKNVEPGDYVAAGTPIVTIGDIADVWLRAYIEETDLGRVKTGQPVDVTTDSYPGKIYAGRISFIAPQAEFTPKSVQTRKERVKLVYRVKVAIANPSMELKPGMPADGVIRIR
ncbi:MAG: HlyD family efflux transporter periplasmic adaptor subunit [Deltaproteobacteria bacterium]|nr:HlyD family efflux transporter periplasmic adaptor subunit [Deltaproteobacteria bacterium]PWB66429.1 MAG: hemolysin secretion protein D [Deltaproteobacteria bacterium]